MKSIKKISLILAATFTLGGAVMANEAREGKRGMDPKARAEKMTERMVKEYNLTDAQKQQLQEVHETLAEKMGNRPEGPHRHGKKGKAGQIGKDKKENKDGVARENREKKNDEFARGEGRRNRPDAPKPSAGEREKRMQEMKQVRENYTAQLQKIMTSDQYQAYVQKQAERGQKREERGEKMKENRSKKSASEKGGKKV